MRFSGAPAKRPRRWSDQAMWKPQLAGRSGATPSSSPAQAPSEPSRGQEAPPSASTVAAGRSSTGPPAPRRPARHPPSPASDAATASVTPSPPSRPSQARSSGEAFIARGKTRPELPMKVGWPSASAQAIRAAGGKASMNGARRSPAPRRSGPRKAGSGSECVRFSPPRPAISSLRAGEGMRSSSVTRAPPVASTSAAISPAGPAPRTATSGCASLSPTCGLLEQ